MRITRHVYSKISSVVYSPLIYNKMDKIFNDSKTIFLKAVEAVNCKNLIRTSVNVNNNKLSICGKKLEVNKNCHVVGFGKAVYHMATEMESILASHLVSGIVSVPVGMLSSQAGQQGASSSRITYIEGAKNNLPDINSEKAAKTIINYVKKLTQDDLLIVLISGGGSALLSLPRSPITLEEKMKVIKMLSKSGADILELNCVRKRISAVKGGRLAAMAYPANVVGLILSDIVGDPLDFIASGPTLPNRDSSDAAMKIIEKYHLADQLPDSVKQILRADNKNDASSNIPKTSDESFCHVTNFVIGNNKLAAISAAVEARKLGYQTSVISTTITGDVSMISKAYTRIALAMIKLMKGISSKDQLLECLHDVRSMLNLSDNTVDELIALNYESGNGVCLVSGGEPTVTVTGDGVGGRSQQLALQFAIDVNNALLQQSAIGGVERMNISLLCCGTDGIDGPTDAAGAFAFSDLYTLAQHQNIDPRKYLQRNDAYHFYNAVQNGKFLIRTGHTGTNVMDIHILTITL